PRLETNRVSDYEAMEDFMMVGLRLLEGVSESDFAAQFPGRTIAAEFGPELAPLLENGLLEITGAAAGNPQGYKLSGKGLPLGNEVFAAFIGTKDEAVVD
ncbi:oxygen-independent coproporphyrinogen III oxidase, partial [Paenibacillus sepulcri]|nr:oxygen-independent coproporphyrinogen III oxidase [Paenibacillus sepulcri]